MRIKKEILLNILLLALFYNTFSQDYVHPASFELRAQVDVIDIGAYEYSVTDPIGKYPQAQFQNIIIRPSLHSLSIILSESYTKKLVLEFFDLRGRIMSTISMGSNGGGNYSVPYSSLNLPAGVYTLRISANDIHKAIVPLKICKKHR